jgi:hypothetical protein
LALTWTVAIANLGCLCADEMPRGVATAHAHSHTGASAHDCCPSGGSHPASHQPSPACAHCDRLQVSLGSGSGLTQMPTGHSLALAVHLVAPTIPLQPLPALRARTAALDPPRAPFLAPVVLRL